MYIIPGEYPISNSTITAPKSFTRMRFHPTPARLSRRRNRFSRRTKSYVKSKKN